MPPLPQFGENLGEIRNRGQSRHCCCPEAPGGKKDHVNVMKDLGDGRRRGTPQMKASQVYPLLLAQCIVRLWAQAGGDAIGPGSTEPLNLQPRALSRWCAGRRHL